MIYTVTLNPALDRTVYVEKLIKYESIRVIREEHYAGGKGIDVSRVIKKLGGQSIALGFLGGYAGMEMEGRLLNEGIACNFVWTKSETRVNVIIHSLEDGGEYRLNFRGPEIRPQEVAELVQKCRSLKPKPTFVVISGSVPEGVDPIIYEQLIITFESQGAKVILDTYGEPLKKGLLATPFMVKPNLVELSEFCGKKLSSIKEIIKAAKELLKFVDVVTVSMGSDGLIGVTKESSYHAIPPRVEAKSTVGAGDSAVAAMVLALERGMPFEEVIRRGAAAGTASTLTDGTATIDINDFNTILANTVVKKISDVGG